VETNPDSKSVDYVLQLIDRFRSGAAGTSDEAAQQLWELYLPRLLALARRKLDPRIRVLQDEEDVVQSMGRSFFRRLRRGDFDLADRDALWALLVTVTLNKVRNAADRHFAAIRDVRRVQALPMTKPGQSDTGSEKFDLEDDDPTPAMAAILNEELEQRLRTLPKPMRRVALLKLEGYTNLEICELLDCSKRNLERKLNLIRKRWEDVSRRPQAT
jgi:RNA polymerase sigma factor (sigma-70 family)